MTLGKASALTAAFIGVFALGVAVGPSVKDKLSDGNSRVAAQPVEPVAAAAPAPAATPTPARTRARTTAANRKAAAASTVTPSTSAVPTSEPRLYDRLKPVLNPGARMEVAAQGFRSAEEFATVAHAARNTNVPFMVLKHRVLNEGRTLADAIHDSKPEVDAKAEVARAEAAAKSDIAALVG